MFISLPTQLWKMVNKNLVPSASSEKTSRIAWGQIIWCTPTVLAYSALSNHLFLVLLIFVVMATACYSHISCGTFLGPKSHRKPDATRFTSTGSPFIAGTDCPTRFVSPAFFFALALSRSSISDSATWWADQGMVRGCDTVVIGKYWKIMNIWQPCVPSAWRFDLITSQILRNDEDAPGMAAPNSVQKSQPFGFFSQLVSERPCIRNRVVHVTLKNSASPSELLMQSRCKLKQMEGWTRIRCLHSG